MLTPQNNTRIVAQAIRLGLNDFLELPAPDQALRQTCADLLKTSYGSAEKSPGGITDREMEILGLIVSGHSNRKMAAMLHRSVRTIENHRSCLLFRLQARGTADLVARAVRLGLVAHIP